MFIPFWLVITGSLSLFILLLFVVGFLRGRNPLPFPDMGSRIFAASTPEAKEALVALLDKNDLKERFRFDSSGILRSILWDGTIVNWSPPEVVDKVKGATSAIGISCSDPHKSAADACEFLKSRGFSAEIVENVEPMLPIVFVLTDALSGAALNFRPHVTKLPRPPKRAAV
jgi:hypothetical protein